MLFSSIAPTDNIFAFQSISRNPAIENEEWPKYTEAKPVFRVFNAEGDSTQKRVTFGHGPMAAECAFWNNYLPRVQVWSGE